MTSSYSHCHLDLIDNPQLPVNLKHDNELDVLRTGDADKRSVYSKQCLVECVLSADLELARSLISDSPETLSWSLPYCLVTCKLLRLRSPSKEPKKAGKEPLLQEIREKCNREGYTWNEGNLEMTRQFAESLTHQDQVIKSLMMCGQLLVSALHTSSDQAQESLGHVATCVSLLASSHVPRDTCMRCLRHLFPAGVATPPDIGQAVLGRELDWQCNWIQVTHQDVPDKLKLLCQVHSIQASHARVLLAQLRHDPDLEVTEAELEDAADGVMMEDVIRRQKLEAEIREGEEAVAGFTMTEVREDESVGEVDNREENNDDTPGVDLTPSLSGAQTLSLAEDGEWRYEHKNNKFMY